ncbi:MAG TPA: hypothetical protein VKX49_15480 [Bryobacteraceae bacterium]|nr:hypothetical protein [Bryobacteraceae bacterium]
MGSIKSLFDQDTRLMPLAYCAAMTNSTEDGDLIRHADLDLSIFVERNIQLDPQARPRNLD